jgi:hypothetical protein
MLATTDPQLTTGGVLVLRPSHQGSLVGTNLKKYTWNKNEIQSSPRDHGGHGHPQRHESKLQTQLTSSIQLPQESACTTR